MPCWSPPIWYQLHPSQARFQRVTAKPDITVLPICPVAGSDHAEKPACRTHPVHYSDNSTAIAFRARHHPVPDRIKLDIAVACQQVFPYPARPPCNGLPTCTRAPIAIIEILDITAVPLISCNSCASIRICLVSATARGPAT